MNREDAYFLNQLANSAGDVLEKLIESYENGNVARFNELKSMFVKIEKRIDEVLEKQ